MVATALAAVALVWLPDAVDGWRSGDGATPGGAAGDPPPLEWAGAAPPTDREQGVLDQITRVFADTGSCRGVPDPDVDPRDVFPSGADNIECRYPGGATTVFSRFGSDAAMHDFFDARLASRGLTVPVPDLSARWPWHVRLEGPPSGRAFGNVNLTRPVDDERVELGLVRDGTATYAYTYAPGEDFETVYEWWYATFLHLS